MTIVEKIAAFDIVELLTPIDDAPAGARGGVIELCGAETAMVAITSPELDPAARIVFAPVAELRRMS